MQKWTLMIDDEGIVSFTDEETGERLVANTFKDNVDVMKELRDRVLTTADEIANGEW
jgi:hypothetical protein